MRRILFQWRGLTIWSYPAMLYFGLVAGVVVGNIAAHATGIDALRVFVSTLVLLPPSIFGARLMYVASHWSEYRGNPSRIWDRTEGGMAMFGGLPVMLLLSLPVLAVAGLGFGEFWDVAVLTTMTGLAFTKIGCYLNGCCGGRGIWARRYPVQLLESLWALVVLSVGSLLLGRLPFRGALFLVVAAIYSTGRLGFESLREPERGDTPGRDRLISILTIAAAVGVLIFQWPR